MIVIVYNHLYTLGKWKKFVKNVEKNLKHT